MPMKLVLDAEEKIRVLKHAEVWESTVPQETPAMVMQSMVDFSTNLKDLIANHIAVEIKRQIQKPGKTARIALNINIKTGCLFLLPPLLRPKQSTTECTSGAPNATVATDSGCRHTPLTHMSRTSNHPSSPSSTASKPRNQASSSREALLQSQIKPLRAQERFPSSTKKISMR